MTTQRKIPHVLASEGEGRAFRYLPALNVPFDLREPIIVTEKVDGSTMQCLNGEPFKRYDRFKAGDPRKHTASEAERYELRPCSRENPHEQHYLDAFDTQADALRSLSRDAWVYFEALGSKIQSRYPGLAPTIRIFDVCAVGGRWWSWDDIDAEVSLRRGWGVRMVAHHTQLFGDLSALLDAVTMAESRDEELGPHALEGWVLRQGDLIAKIRKNDIARIASGAA